MAKKTLFDFDKKKDFSKWYSEIVQKAELGDLRYNVKGFLVFQPWAVLCMEKMYDYLERELKRKGHKPYWFPTVIPEKNFKLEGEHVKGFTPEVFWVTHGGKNKFEEKLALRPTSETAFYQMFALWIRSYKDLPFKTYQRANIFRYETKATRPFLRSREFHWIEGHCAHASEEDAMKQVYEDMDTTKKILGDVFCLPFMVFERPSWDKFPGAKRTFATDVLNPDGRIVQQPSTHLLNQDFSKAFDVKFVDKDEKEKNVWLTCYGPAVSRIFASVVAVHGDNKGLRFPWKIAPIQVVIVPIGDDKKVIKKAEELKELLWDNYISVEVDKTEKSFGEKLYYWEMKGVPLRIELGNKEIDEKKLTLFRRDNETKEKINEKDLISYISKVSIDIDKNLKKQAESLFKGNVVDVKNIKEMKEVVDSGKIARCGFCSMSENGEKCAEVVEKETGGMVRGVKLDEKEKGFSKCVVCGKKADCVTYVAKQY